MPDNPFRYGELVSGRFFTNREQELGELESDFGSGRNVVVMSPRRFGKTSLVLTAIDRVRKQGVLVAYVDLFGLPTKAAFVRGLAKALHEGLMTPMGQKLQVVADAFKGLSVTPKLSIGPDGAPSLEIAPGRSEEDLDRDLEILFHMPARIARTRHARVAIVFDEFQQILSIGADLPARMMSVFQHQADVAHVCPWKPLPPDERPVQQGQRAHVQICEANEVGWPSQPFEVVQAVSVGPEPGLELADGLRVVGTSATVVHLA